MSLSKLTVIKSVKVGGKFIRVGVRRRKLGSDANIEVVVILLRDKGVAPNGIIGGQIGKISSLKPKLIAELTERVVVLIHNWVFCDHLGVVEKEEDKERSRKKWEFN